MRTNTGLCSEWIRDLICGLLLFVSLTRCLLQLLWFPTEDNLEELLLKRKTRAFLWKTDVLMAKIFIHSSTFRKQIITGCIMSCSIMLEVQDCWVRYYSMCFNCKMMIILSEHFNDRWGDSFFFFLFRSVSNSAHILQFGAFKHIFKMLWGSQI